MYDNGKQSRKFRFSKTKIDSLPPNPKGSRSSEQEYSDEQVTGLRVLVSKNGRKFFYMRYNFNRRKRAIKIGEFPSTSVEQARNKVNDFRRMISEGQDPKVQKDKQNDVPSFEEFINNDYLPFAKENKRTWKDDLGKLEKDMIPKFGELKMSQIETKDIQRYLTKIKARSSATNSNRHYSLLHRIFNLAIEWGNIKDNPCKTIKKQKESGGRTRYLKDDELKRFLSALDQMEESPSTNAIKFLLFTGLRMSEALNLEWEHVNLETGSIFLVQTKSGTSRNVVLNELALEVLVRMKELQENEFVFPGPGPNKRLMRPKRAFNSVKKVAGIENLRMHDLRHSFASIAVNSGASLYEVQKLLGHHSSQMTQRYAHLGDREMKAATDSVAKQIKKVDGDD